ncbi:MAG: VOC family protein [Bacteroidetes bacterium]|nr:VOC family protein [Bacteroidota bacterium]
MKISAILETILYAEDLDAAERFYSGILGLDVYARQPGRHVFFRCGQSMFLVFNPAVTSVQQLQVNGSPVPPHGARGNGHVAFRMDDNYLPSWRERLESNGVEIESVVDWPGGGKSLYFRDPAGNSVELASPKLWGLANDEWIFD